ncbi:MAG: hypothetical protein MJ132_03255, partial [Clostridia bacterium]|nr:hypothetical protein [Clostridia bacterium]
MKLNGEWLCSFTCPGQLPKTIPATVPGCLHTDLQAAGIVGDFFYRDNAESVQWIENCDAVYTKRFTLTEIAPNSVLCFHGLDVYCDIFLNGKKIGSADDMFIPHRFAVENDLQVGENLLEVCFRSPIKEVADKPQGIGAFTTERLNTRRMQCTYGWDWVARFVTMGICDDVVLESALPNSPDQVYVYTACVSETAATVAIDATFQNLCGREQAVFTVTDPSGKTVFSKSVPVAETVSVTAEISKARLWYPVGYGEQPLYCLKICAGGTEKQTTFGIRTVKIEETVDQPDSVEYIKARELQRQKHLRNSDKNETTSSFRLLVNDTPIFCQGGNWVPSEPFYSAEDPQKIRHLVRMARNGGVNMLRVWGGGCFEKQAFYDACDEYGILVTQDLLMACGIYPEEDPDFIEKMTVEAETAALKLRNHPCLVWWAGDNENSVLGQLKNGEFSGNISSLYAGEKVLRRLDPTHRYFLSSPYGGKPYTSATVGTTHNTSFLGDWFDFIWDGNTAEYRQETEKYLSRFMDEQPAFGASFASSMKSFLKDEDIFGSDDAMLEYHCQTNPGLPHTLFEYAKKA